jgi:hypothetical protein
MNKILVYALGGDALTSPEHTETSFLAALGGGAGGIVSGVRLSKDGVSVCANHNTFEQTCGDKRAVREMTWNEISKLDAGFTFCSMPLDNENQPSGDPGKDKPWQGNLPKKPAIRVLRLDQALILLARRCTLMLLLPPGENDLVDAVVSELKKYGVLNRVKLLGDLSVCKYIEGKYPCSQYVLIGAPGQNPSEQLRLAEALGAKNLCLDWDNACHNLEGRIEFDPDLKENLTKSNVRLLLESGSMPFAPKPAYFKAVQFIEEIEGIIAAGTLPTVEGLTPSALIAQDDFAGKSVDQKLWAAGYSHINQDTVISQNDGLCVDIIEGGSYSGAAAVCLIPLHGRFDAQVDFHVGNPKQGTTFEMAAICIDPGYHHMNNSDLNTRNVNLTFDVHGAPPYASSERDEDDGFRCGWNNGFNLTKVDPNWEAASVNMYNKYGRDVGNGDADNPVGSLRLIRNGSVFTTYYKDKYNDAWVCSGSMPVQNMSDDVYIRLAAKHWNKGSNPPPGNSVRFYGFRLYQF